MAKDENRFFQLKKAQVNLDLSNVPSNTILFIASDGAGNKEILEFDLKDLTAPNQVILRNTTTGKCFKPVGGVWQWVPC
jgi:hypothetical protein